MSTEGAGKVCITAGAPLIAGIGAGLLVAEGIMWCGEALSNAFDNYLAKTERAFALAHQAMLEKSRAQQGTLNTLPTILEAIAVNQMFRSTFSLPSQSEQEQAQIQHAIARAQAALTDAYVSVASPADLEYMRLQYALKREIVAGRVNLPVSLIQEAIDALDAPAEAITAMLERLREERRQLEGRLLNEERQRRELSDLLGLAQAQLTGIGQMLQELSSAQRARFLEQQKAIQQLLDTTTLMGDGQIEHALGQATRAHQGTRALVESVSSALLEARSETHKQINEHIGALQALQELLKDARRIPGAEWTEARALMERVTTARDETEALTQRPLPYVQAHLQGISERVVLLKQEVFTFVEGLQQQVIADTIAGTLAELGFHAPVGEQRLVHENGDMIRVVASPVHEVEQGQRDDKLVTFDISRAGDVTYDFIGYTGDACLADAEQIFTALRARGLYILDPKIAQRMQEALARGQTITQHMLQQPEVLAHPVQNKMQAELAQRLRIVLEQMQYQNIQQQVVGGSIEIEAFNGEIGYRAIVAPEGLLQLSKEDETGEQVLPLDANDPLAAEARQVRSQGGWKARRAASTEGHHTLPKRIEQKLQGL